MTANAIDLRSDTVTRPDDQMRRAMAAAEVGDDVYREDPTILELERVAADMFGKEAGLLVTSGVQGNLVALLTLATRGTEVLVEADAHLVNYEGGAGAQFAGVQFRTVQASNGQLTPQQVAEHIRPDHFPLTATSLVAVEQTHNRRGGTAYTVDQMNAVAAVVSEAGLPLYIDGARIFNAILATGTTPQTMVEQADALSFCLSKGLGAPVGSVFLGTSEVVEVARGWRRRLGGAMRQAGVIAAAGLVALSEGPARLSADHEHARLLFDAAHEVLGPQHAATPPQTNIVYVDDVDAAAAVAGLATHGVRAGAMDPRTLRLVTHRDISSDDARVAASALKTVLSTQE